eukprot:TRINITY_DN2529_c0_g1_i2.p1 TRINITY_DN2529_c0_g1~~TRINITY_DN2529_c0_g1_i2.p1  ORF type:complete len:230 (-),score=52.35 TRINITY_DN2529_c0_g1_i2:5-643(-)
MFRILGIQDYKICTEWYENDIVEDVNRQYAYYVEEVPEDEKLFLSLTPTTIKKDRKKPPPKDVKKVGGATSGFEAVVDAGAGSETNHVSYTYTPKDQRIQCIHTLTYWGYDIRYHGDPFFFIFKKGETVKEASERIRQKLQVDKNDFKTWKFYRWCKTSNGREKRRILDDIDIITSKDYNNPIKGPAYFIMEHKPIEKKRNQKALQIGGPIK